MKPVLIICLPSQEYDSCLLIVSLIDIFSFVKFAGLPYFYCTTCATCRAGSAYLSEAAEITLVFGGVRVA